MEEVSFENSRNLELKGVLRPAKSNAGIIMAHGLTGDREENGYFIKAAEALNQAGYNVFAFDFSGRGESEGSLSIKNAVDDLNSAIEFLKKRNIDRVGLYGYSMGGLISLKASDNKFVESLFLTSPVTASFDLPGGELTDLSLRIFDEVFKIELNQRRKLNWISRELSEEFISVDQKELLSQVEQPVKIVHGRRDLIVDVENSRNAEKILDNCELHIIEGMGHSYNQSNTEKIIEAAETWFREHMPP